MAVDHPAGTEVYVVGGMGACAAAGTNPGAGCCGTRGRPSGAPTVDGTTTGGGPNPGEADTGTAEIGAEDTGAEDTGAEETGAEETGAGKLLADVEPDGSAVIRSRARCGTAT